MTPEDRFEVGIIVARRRLKGPWASHVWMPVAALPAAAQAEPWTKLSETEEEATFYAGAYEVSLHIGEIVEAVPMPPELQAKLLAFFEAFHIERKFEKRKRDRADPEALARRAPGSQGKPE